MSEPLLNSHSNASKCLRPEWLFAGYALLFGVVLVFVNAPFQAPDEGAHFWRAYHVYQGDLISTHRGATVGGEIPVSVAHAYLPYEYLIGHSELRMDSEVFSSDLVKPFDAEERVFQNLFFPGLYVPFVYAPQAIGIAVARLCGFSALKMMYAGRLSALLCWIGVLYAAIRITPVFKWVFVLVALLPRSLFQAASLSADGPTNAIAMLLTALILCAIFDPEETLGKGLFWMIILLSVLLSVSKQVYLPLVGLVLLIPAGKFNGWRKKIFFCGCVIGAAVLATGLWSMVIRNLYTPYNGANAPEQLALLMARPWIFPVIAVKSFMVSWVGLFVSFIGVLGFLDVWLPNWVYFTYPFGLLAAALFDANCKEPLNGLKRCWILLICIISFFLIELSMYLTWTQPGAPIVCGVHGRYFIPLAIPALLALFYNRKLAFFNRPILLLAVFLYLFAVLTASCWALYIRYYGPVS
ncbi:MAG: DUF2142 domain-containing protein [Planctomycetota bacterium]|jgi:uncharacterized membrane protein